MEFQGERVEMGSWLGILMIDNCGDRRGLGMIDGRAKFLWVYAILRFGERGGIMGVNGGGELLGTRDGKVGERRGGGTNAVETDRMGNLDWFSATGLNWCIFGIVRGTVILWDTERAWDVIKGAWDVIGVAWDVTGRLGIDEILGRVDGERKFPPFVEIGGIILGISVFFEYDEVIFDGIVLISILDLLGLSAVNIWWDTKESVTDLFESIKLIPDDDVSTIYNI